MRRMKREQEASVAQSWTTAAMTGAAQAGKLKPLNHYIRRKQSPSEMLAVIREFKARGANMTITKIER